MEALSSSETSVLKRAARRNIPKDDILRSTGRSYRLQTASVLPWRSQFACRSSRGTSFIAAIPRNEISYLVSAQDEMHFALVLQASSSRSWNVTGKPLRSTCAQWNWRLRSTIWCSARPQRWGLPVTRNVQNNSIDGQWSSGLRYRSRNVRESLLWACPFGGMTSREVFHRISAVTGTLLGQWNYVIAEEWCLLGCYTVWLL
jgi:hypothetical protein